LVRGDSLEKSMSYYLVEQLRVQKNVAVQLRSEIGAVHGDTHLTAIDIRASASAEVRRHDCGGLFIFIGADAETAWLPVDIARRARLRADRRRSEKSRALVARPRSLSP
jgi:thioredoxin reductase (NADPH)